MEGANIVATVDATFENTLELTVETDDVYESSTSKVLYNTTEYWNSRPQLIAKEGYLYVYADHKQEGDEIIPGFKVGDGTSYLIDMPFTDLPLDNHIADTVKHITDQERTFWNNKVRCFVDPENEYKLVFTTN